MKVFFSGTSLTVCDNHVNPHFGCITFSYSCKCFSSSLDGTQIFRGNTTCNILQTEGCCTILMYSTPSDILGKNYINPPFIFDSLGKPLSI